MKTLILVLSAMREPWGAMLNTALETWDSQPHSETETLYYCGKSSEQSKPGLFYSPNHDEELERVSPRTIEAFEHALTLDWEMMARPHSSTYVHKQNLVDFIQTLPRQNVLCGLMTTGLNPFLWGGGSYIISRDVVEKFVANKDRWNLNIMEDNSLTNLARDLDIPMDGTGRMASINYMPDGSVFVMPYGIGEPFSFTDWSEIKKAHPHYFFRCKQDLKRHLDLDIFRKLHENL